MANLSALAPITTTATALSNLILVTPQLAGLFQNNIRQTVGYQPQNPPNSDGTSSQAAQPPALLFNYEGENLARLSSDITDHYIEDNTAIQDQIALRPERVTTHGFIGELNNVPPPGLDVLQQAADKLTTITGYLPTLTETALIAYDEAFFAYQVASNIVQSAVSTWNSVTGQAGENVIDESGLGNTFNAATGKVTGVQSKQQVAFQQFYGYWRNRTLFTVQTPWAVFKNMAIEEITAIQDEKTRMVTDFNITFKMIRTASTATLTGLSALLQGRLNSQASGITDLGSQTPVSSIDMSTGLANMGVA